MRIQTTLIIRWALALLALACALPAQAQGRPARLDVAVVDSGGKPVLGARIAVNGSAAPILTDSAGNASVQGIIPGTRLMTVRYPGFREERALLDLAAGAQIAIRVVLTPEALALDTVTVTGQRFVLALHHNGFYKRRQQGLGRFMDREDVAQAGRISGDLCPLMRGVPGFRVEAGTPGLRCAIVSARGGAFEGPCVPEIRIDGMVADMEQFAALAPQHVEGIEAYATDAEVPAEYSSATMCGVILIWLRKS